MQERVILGLRIAYRWDRDARWNTLRAKAISDQKSFSGNDSHERAKAFVDAHPDYRIMDTSQVVSPIALEKLEHYKLIHQSGIVEAEKTSIQFCRSCGNARDGKSKV
jgi:hypothetical protein